MTQGSEPLHERMARSIERLRAGCRNATGAEPTIDPPPTDEQIASAAHELGRPIPEPLRELYRVADGLEAYGFGLSSTAWLGHTERDRAEHIVDWEPGGGFHQLVWGPRPQGRTLGLGCEHGFLLIEEDGPGAGALTALAGDDGYHPLAPSLEVLLDAWATVAEAGLIFMATDPAGNRSPVADHEQALAIDAALHGHECGPAAVGLFPANPADRA